MPNRLAKGPSGRATQIHGINYYYYCNKNNFYYLEVIIVWFTLKSSSITVPTAVLLLLLQPLDKLGQFLFHPIHLLLIFGHQTIVPLENNSVR